MALIQPGDSVTIRRKPLKVLIRTFGKRVEPRYEMSSLSVRNDRKGLFFAKAMSHAGMTEIGCRELAHVQTDFRSELSGDARDRVEAKRKRGAHGVR